MKLLLKKNKLIISTLLVLLLSASSGWGKKKNSEVDQLSSNMQKLELELKKSNDQTQVAKTEIADLRSDSDVLWLVLASILVFFMQAGFALVEAGFTRSKNTVNILMKNLSDFFLGFVVFWLIGFSIMFGPKLIDSFAIGQAIEIGQLMNKDGAPVAWNYAFFLFQAVFCGTAATIVSGAMAERTKFGSYLIASAIITGIIYPIYGSMAWSNLFDANNGGWLSQMGFIDFAGSTVVHSLGGWIGLAGAIVLKPRNGKYGSDGSVRPIFGHNMTMSTLGVFILWFGWFGFNPGSTATIKGGSFATIAVATNMAAVGGGLGSLFLSYLLFKVSDISMTLNGILAGLVAITAGCFNVNIYAAGIIGFVAGMLVVGSVILFDNLKIDDPVGAVSVHGVCGLWGTLAVGLFAQSEFGGGPNGLFFGGGWEPLYIQFVGAATAFVWAFPMGLILFLLIKKFLGLRVNASEEDDGLDQGEHGNAAYWFNE